MFYSIHPKNTLQENLLSYLISGFIKAVKSAAISIIARVDYGSIEKHVRVFPSHRLPPPPLPSKI
jgi:hypothetical protein